MQNYPTENSTSTTESKHFGKEKIIDADAVNRWIDEAYEIEKWIDEKLSMKQKVDRAMLTTGLQFIRKYKEKRDARNSN